MESVMSMADEQGSSSESIWGALELVIPATAADTPADQHDGDGRGGAGLPSSHLPPKHIELRKRRVLIGRQPGNDVVLANNPCISATHCCISYVLPSSCCEQQDDAVIVSLADCSSNGCFVNAVKVGKGRIHSPLMTGDLIHLVMAAPNKINRYNVAYMFRRIILPCRHATSHGEQDPFEKPAATAKDNGDGSCVLREGQGSCSDGVGAGATNIPLGLMVIPSTSFVENLLTPRIPVGGNGAPQPQSIPRNGEPSASFASQEEMVKAAGGAHSPSFVDREATIDQVEQHAPSLRGGRVASVAEIASTNGGGKKGNPTASSIIDPGVGRTGLSGDVDVVPDDDSRAVKVWRHSIDELYDLDRSAPLGTGSFATVYRGVRKLQKSISGQLLTPPVVAVKVVKKERAYLTDDKLLPTDRVHDTTIARILDLEQQLDESTKCSGGLFVLDEDDDGRAEQQQDEETSRHHRRRELRDLRHRLTPRLLALIDKEVKHRRRQQCEIEILTAVKHPHIVRLYQVVDTPATLSFVLDLAEGGELFHLVFAYGSLPEFLVKIMIFQVLEAVLYLHQLGIAHRDIKLENLLLAKSMNCEMVAHAQMLSHQGASSGQQLPPPVAIPMKRPRSVETSTAPTSLRGAARSPPGHVDLERQQLVFLPQSWWPLVKVSDFGLSRIVCPLVESSSGSVDADRAGGGADMLLMRAGGNKLMTTMCGTPIYVAPEVTIASLRQDAAGYTPAVDLFSVGAAAFALLTARPPFPHQKDPVTGRASSRIDYGHPLTWDRRGAPASSTSTEPTPVQTTPVLFRQAKDIAISEAGKEMVSSLLSMQPKKRMTAGQALRHRWFNDIRTVIKQGGPGAAFGGAEEAGEISC